MRLKNVQIVGYRSLRDVSVPLTDLTSLIGPNGSGKSSVLGAIRLFLDPTATVDHLDFWSGSAEDGRAEVVSVRVEWTDLAPGEASLFDAYLDAGELTVERRFEEPGKGTYLSSRRAVPEFSTVRRLERAHREEYAKLVDSGEFAGLAIARNRTEVFAAMDVWELANSDRCVVSDEEFSPITSLLDASTFVYVGAFEDPSTHLDAGGPGAVGRLIARVVDQSSVRAELQSVADDASGKSSAIMRKAEQKLDAVSDSMAEMVESFAPGCCVKLDWDDVTVRSAVPRLKVDIQNSDGLRRPLEYQGHGIQRSLMYAVLTADVATKERDQGTIILLIEEPEAFQHPLSRRVLARTLRNLGQRDYQIVYSTHSAEFIHADIVDGLRIVRRENTNGAGMATSIKSLSSSELLGRWQEVFLGGGYTLDSVSGRLAAHLSPAVLEGLFAHSCMLVEGDEDEAIVRGVAANLDIELEASGIAVIQTNGKTGMPNVVAFLALAGVDCYPVFDLDRGLPLPDQHRESEEQILRAIGVAGPAIQGVHGRYACWDTNLTETVSTGVGSGYEELLKAAAEKFGYPKPSKARKVAVVITEVLRSASELGSKCPELDELADRLRRLVAAGGQPRTRSEEAPGDLPEGPGDAVTEQSG